LHFGFCLEVGGVLVSETCVCVCEYVETYMSV